MDSITKFLLICFAVMFCILALIVIYLMYDAIKEYKNDKETCGAFLLHLTILFIILLMLCTLVLGTYSDYINI